MKEFNIHELLSGIKSYGSTKIGPRGQLVIPKEIREKLKIKSGDKFYVFTKFEKVVAMVKVDEFDDIMDNMISLIKQFKSSK